MKNINWGIIGCGDVTEIKSGPAFSKITGSSLYMVMRRNEKKVKDYARRHNVDRYTTDYFKLLHDPKINAIYIATPPNMHCFYTLEAAKHKKIVYVEKPMSTSVRDCKKMIEACRENKVPLYVAYYRRGQKKFKTIKKIIESGEIGKNISFYYSFTCTKPIHNPERSWLLDKKIAGEGLLYDIGSHMIDTALFLFGDYAYAQGISHKQSDNLDFSDIVSGIIKFKNGIQGCIQLSFDSNEQIDKFKVVGEKGSISFSVMSNDPIVLISDGKEKIIEFEPIQHVQMPYIKDVIDDIRGMNILEREGLYGLRTQEILEVFSNNKSTKF